MTATMNPGVLPQTWDVTCPEHSLDRRGLTQYHAQNVVRKHNREDHAQGYQIGRVAALVLAAQEDLHLARQEAVDPDKGWAETFAQRRLEEVLAVWMTLCAIPLSERDTALARAREAVQQDLVAHVAPF